MKKKNDKQCNGQTDKLQAVHSPAYFFGHKHLNPFDEDDVLTQEPC